MVWSWRSQKERRNKFGVTQSYHFGINRVTECQRMELHWRNLCESSIRVIFLAFMSVTWRRGKVWRNLRASIDKLTNRVRWLLYKCLSYSTSQNVATCFDLWSDDRVGTQTILHKTP
jgi:hypothetical protein